MLMYGFEHLRSAGITEIGIVLGPLQEGIRESFGDGSKFKVKITYIEQPDPKGIAHAVLISKKFLGEDSFIVYLGDNLLKDSVPKLAREFHDSTADVMVVVTKVDDPSRFGVVKIENERIVKLVEKPKQFLSDLALTGVYFFRPSIFPAIETLKPSWRNELEITEAIQAILSRGGKVIYHTVSGWWKDTGRPEDILEANKLVLDDLKTSILGKVEEGVTVYGNVEIAQGTVIRRGASILGPVTISEGSEIGEDARVGPFASIGSRVKILRAEVENSIVLDGTTIDCAERIVDSIIGKNSKIVSNPTDRRSGRRLVVGENTFVGL